MKLTKKVQYGLLFTTYLSRVGFSNLHFAAEALGISSNFLEQVAHKLKNAEIVTVTRGPGGGYRMNLEKESTIGDVIKALGSVDFLTREEIDTNSSMYGGASLNLINILFKTSIASVLSTPVKSVTFPAADILSSLNAQYDKTN